MVLPDLITLMIGVYTCVCTGGKGEMDYPDVKAVKTMKYDTHA